jgi:hypothetical protein
MPQFFRPRAHRDQGVSNTGPYIALRRVGNGTRNVLLVPKRHRGIHAGGAPCRRVGGREAGHAQQYNGE